MIDLRKKRRAYTFPCINTRSVYLRPTVPIMREIAEECARIGNSDLQGKIDRLLRNCEPCVLEPHMCLCLADVDKEHYWLCDVIAFRWVTLYGMTRKGRVSALLVADLKSITYK